MLVIVDERLLQGLDDVQTQSFYRRDVGGVRNDEREFVAAEAADGHGIRYDRIETGGNLAKQMNAGHMPTGIIALLEPVEVDQQHGEQADILPRHTIEERRVGEAW